MAQDSDEEHLPDDSRIILFVSGGKTRPWPRPEGEVCKEIDADALKCDDDGISVTCVDAFEGEGDVQLLMAAKAMTSRLTVRKSGYIAQVSVGEFLSALSDEPEDVRIEWDRLDHNEGHCLIKGIASDNIGLKMVAADAFKDFIPVTALPELLG